MSKMLRVWLRLAIAFLLMSCVTGIRMDTIQGVHRGMTYDDFKKQVAIEPKQAFPLQHGGSQYTVERYSMQTGTRAQTTYVGGYTTTAQLPVYEDYYFVFESNSLRFWGFMTELQKSEDELVQQLAPRIVEQEVADWKWLR